MERAFSLKVEVWMMDVLQGTVDGLVDVVAHENGGDWARGLR